MHERNFEPKTHKVLGQFNAYETSPDNYCGLCLARPQQRLGIIGVLDITKVQDSFFAGHV